MKELKKFFFLFLVKYVFLAFFKRLLGDLFFCFRGSVGESLGVCVFLMNFEEKGSISDVKDKKRFYYIEGLRLDLRDFLNVSC